MSRERRAPRTPARGAARDASTNLRTQNGNAPTRRTQSAGDGTGIPAGRTAGVVTGWRAPRGTEGEMARSAIARIISECRLPITTMPASRTGHAHAARALRFLETEYSIVREGRGESGHWEVRSKESGARVATVTTAGDEIKVDADERGLRVRILGEWARLRDEEAFAPGDVTEWIRGIIHEQFRGVRLALNVWFVPYHKADRAMQFCRAIAATGWGEWLPALSQTADESLRRALSAGLLAEVQEVRRFLGYALQEAASRGSVPGAASLQRLADQLRDTAVRALRLERELDVPLEDVRSAADSIMGDISRLVPGPTSATLWADAEVMEEIT